MLCAKTLWVKKITTANRTEILWGYTDELMDEKREKIRETGKEEERETEKEKHKQNREKIIEK